MSLVRRIARPLLASVFVVSGLDQAARPTARAHAARPLVTALNRHTVVPADPELVVRANGVTMAGAGLMLAAGRLPRVASSVLAGSLVPTTLIDHAFWRESDPARRRDQQLQLLKNLGLLGGLLLAAVDTEGKPGVAYRARLAKDSVRRGVESGRKDVRYALRSAWQEARLRGVQARHSLD